MKLNGNQRSIKKIQQSVILPGCTELYQPNRLTNSKYKSFTLMQSRILVTLIKELQDAILASMNDKDWEQMNLFPAGEPGLIRVPLRLKDIAKPRQYREVYEATLQLAKTSIRLPSSISKEYYNISSLFPRVELPKRVGVNSIIYVDIFKGAARTLIEIDKTGNGRPGYFTKYLYEVAMSASNKYTYKLYMIIASWKQKGGFKISLQELKAQLGIAENEYPEYCDFKKRVLQPAQKDLEYKSDCWFNCTIAGFEERNYQKKVIWLHFKIIVPATHQIVKEKSDYIKYLLRSYFQFDDYDFKALDALFPKLMTTDTIERVLLKLQDLKEYIGQAQRTNKPIYNVPRYVTKALLNQF